MSDDYVRPVRRLLVGTLVLALFGLFLIWRIDSPRVERFRTAFVDSVVPSFDWALVPVNTALGLIGEFQSYSRMHEQNQELRRELHLCTLEEDAT
jgi:rod shape-determining protein MreC